MQIDAEMGAALNQLAGLHGTAVNCAADSHLINRGDSNSGFFRLLSGSAEILLDHRNGTLKAMALQPGQWFGQSPLSAEDAFSFAVRCTSDCTFERVAWSSLAEPTAGLLDPGKAFDRFTHRLRTIELLIQTFHRTYSNISSEFLEDLIQSAHFTHLEENQRLYERGDNAQVMYFLLSGKIDVYVGSSDQLNRVGEIFHGEPFGEMSLFSNEKRTATLVATRTCDLISLDRKHFDRLSIKYPWLSTYIVTSLINRVKKQNARNQKKYQPVNRLLLAANTLTSPEVSDRLKTILQSAGESVVARELVTRKFGHRGLAEIPHSQMSDYLESLEQNHAKNVYFSTLDAEEWTKICLERADEVWLMVDAGADPSRVDEALGPFKPLFSWQRQKKHLVILQKDLAHIGRATPWLERLFPDRHFHIDTSPAALNRLARYLTDKSLGLVLGGGGARGFAQVGILKAFEEAGISVDWIGGTSIGSIIGGWIAMGWDSRQIVEAVKRFFVTVNPLGDYTLPMISLSKSQRLDSLLQQGFGDVTIEDLPLPYYCVSSDMSMAEERHHESGTLWKATRASISIPRVIAPVINDGHYLVDGGLFNNLPCDLMRQRNNGPIAAVDVSPDEEYLTQLQKVPSPWELVMNKLFKRHQPKVLSILETLLRSSTLASTNRQRANRAIVDYFIQPNITGVGMLDFKQADMIIEAGYREGLRTLEQGMWMLGRQ